MRSSNRFCSYLVLGLVLVGSAAHAQIPSTSPSPAALRPSLPVYPLDTVILPNGDALIVDRNLPGLWRWHDGQVDVFLRGSKRFREPLNAPRCLALDKSGHVLVGDSSTREIYRVDDSQTPRPLTGGKVGIPTDIAVRADGSLVVADLETHSLLRISADGQQLESLARVNPRGVFVDQQDRMWVISQDPQQLLIVGDDGKTQAIVSQRTFEFPHQVVVNSKGEAFVSDGYKKAIWKVTVGAAPELAVSGAPLDNPVGLTLHDDQVVVTDPRAGQVFRLRDGKCEPWFAIGK